MAEIFEAVTDGPVALRFTAFDGSCRRAAGRRLRPAPAQPARGCLPGHRARRPRPGQGLRRRGPRHRRRAPGRPLSRPRRDGQDAVPGPAAPHARRRGADPRHRPAAATAATRAGGPAPLAPRGGGPAALQDPRRRRHPPPLRRVQRLLRARARPVDDLHLRQLPARGRVARGGPGEQVPPGLRQAPARGGGPAARHRLRLGRDGAVCRAAGCARHRRHPVAGAGGLGPGRDRARGARAPRRGAVRGLPRRARDGVRRRLLDRAHRAHRGAELPGILPLHPRPAAGRWAAAQPLHHPARQPRALHRRLHRPLRLPRRRADGLGHDHHRGPERRPRGPPRGEPARALRADAGGLVPQPRAALGRVRGGRRARPRPGSGGSTWPVPATASRPTSSSSTRCWPSSSTTGAAPPCRCARGGMAEWSSD